MKKIVRAVPLIARAVRVAYRSGRRRNNHEKGAIMGNAMSSSRQLLTASVLAGAVFSVSAAQTSDEYAYLTLQGDHVVSVRDSRTLAVIATIPTDGQSIDSRITPDHTKLYTLNVGSAKMSVLRLKCPADKDNWNETERAAGRCVANSQLPAVTIPGAGGGYFSIRRDGEIIYVASFTPDPNAPKGANPFASAQSYVTVVSIRTDKVLKQVATPKGKMAIAAEISPDSKTIWIATGDGFVQGLDPETGVPSTPMIFVGLVPATIKISPDGKRLFAANMPPVPGMMGAPAAPSGKPVSPPVATVGVVDITTQKLIKTISMTPNSMITGIEVSGASNQVWTANANNTVAVIDMGSLKLLKTITTPFETAEAVEISTDGERALVIGFNGKLFEPGTATPGAKSPAFARLYSTKTFQPLTAPISIGNNSGGIPSISAE
jgi:DNA-binding beta-propeller fold protein YncE